VKAATLAPFADLIKLGSNKTAELLCSWTVMSGDPVSIVPLSSRINTVSIVTPM
jgi:hypothetical protein